MKKSVFLTILVVGLGAILFAQDSEPILGVLEDTPGHYVGEPHYRSVRVVFAKQDSAWIAFPSNCPDRECMKNLVNHYPKRVTWTVSFDGKQIGALTTEAPNRFELYSTVGQEQIVGDSQIPTIGEPSQSFAGFLGEPVYRPLVVNSGTFFADPEKWKPVQPTTMILSRVRRAFRHKFPRVSNCSGPDESKDQPWLYSDNDIHVLSAYSSLKGWTIIRVVLEPYRCDGPSEEPFVDQWFVFAPDSTVRFLGKAMWLVDAGDYDNDRHSELVFSIDDYNRGGYILFYDDFKKSATFEFGYH